MKDAVATIPMNDAPVILIVDDESDITITYSMLFGYHGFQVVTASDGESALQLIDAAPPDIILSDYMMPLMNGAELCSILKSDHRWKDIPFIISSAAFQIKDINTPYDLLLQKPVVFSELLKEIKRLLENKKV